MRGMIGEEFVDHLGAGLRPLSDRDRGLRTDDAGIRLCSQKLPMSDTAALAATTASVGPTLFCALACALCCAPPDGSNASTMMSQNATRSKKNMTAPVSLFNSF